MPKILTDVDLLNIVRRTVEGDEIDDTDQYARFLEGLGELIAGHFGGAVGEVVRPAANRNRGTWAVSFVPNDSLPDMGGVFADYDPAVVWDSDGTEKSGPATREIVGYIMEHDVPHEDHIMLVGAARRRLFHANPDRGRDGVVKDLSTPLIDYGIRLHRRGRWLFGEKFGPSHATHLETGAPRAWEGSDKFIVEVGDKFIDSWPPRL
jgi:hypothetical protein